MCLCLSSFLERFGEFAGEFTNVLGARANSERKHLIQKVSTLILIVGLAVEIPSVVRANILFERTITLLEATVEHERLETARIYSRLGPRHLMEEQRKGIAGKVSKYSGIPVDVFVLDQEDRPTMDEALTFGRDIVDALGQSMDASGFIGHECRTWPVVGVLVEASQDLSRDRYAAGEILDSLKSFEIEVYAFVPPVQIPPCAAFSGISLTPTKPRNRTGWAKIVIIIGKKPMPILSQMPASAEARRP